MFLRSPFLFILLSVIWHAACVTLHLSLVRMLHFLPAPLTLWENQYLLVPAGRTNSLWNSVFLRQTIPGGCDTAASRQAFGRGDGSGILVDHCTLIEARIRHFMELDAGRQKLLVIHLYVNGDFSQAAATQALVYHWSVVIGCWESLIGVGQMWRTSSTSIRMWQSLGL